MRFAEEAIVFQEIPNEISLAFTITGCQLKCKGCHSSYLWNSKNGQELTAEYFLSILQKYDGLISCILFMGGEWDADLIKFLALSKERHLKTALYTGLDSDQVSEEIKDNLTYLKYGSWVYQNGGLNSKTTNQRLVNLKTNEILNHYFQ